MKWLRHCHPPVPPDVDADPDGAEAARRHAERELRRVRAQRDEVSNVSRKLRDIKTRNHFAELVTRTLSERTD